MRLNDPPKAKQSGKKSVVDRTEDGTYRMVVVSSDTADSLARKPGAKSSYIDAAFSLSTKAPEARERAVFAKLFSQTDCLTCLDAKIISVDMLMPNGHTYQIGHKCVCQTGNEYEGTASIMDVPDYPLDCQLSQSCTLAQRVDKCFKTKCPRFSGVTRSND